MMTMTQIAALARDVMLRDGRHAPTLVVEGSRQGGVVALKDLPDDPAEKHLMMQGAGYTIGKRPDLGELVRVFLISEAWGQHGHGRQTPRRPPIERSRPTRGADCQQPGR